jgi:putative FmdB family regulatory protein
MPQLRQYRCLECEDEFEVLFEKIADVTSTARCPECGSLGTRLFGGRILIDTWSPRTMNAQRDIEHFEKRSVVNGKYKDTRGIYREDRMKKDIPMNLKEV